MRITSPTCQFVSSLANRTAIDFNIDVLTVKKIILSAAVRELKLGIRLKLTFAHFAVSDFPAKLFKIRSDAPSLSTQA